MQLATILGDALLASHLLAIAQLRRGTTAEFVEEEGQGRGPLRFSFDVAPKEAVDYFKSKKIVTRKEFDELAADARAAAFTVSGIYNEDVLAGFKHEIEAAIDKGTAQQEVIKRFKEILKGAGHKELGAFHLETIFRTNMQMAYGVGRRRALEEVTDDLPYWTYHTAGDDRVRDSHRALNGITLRYDHEFWTGHYPPWDFNCRCTVTAGTREPDGYNHNNPSGEAEIYYDDHGMPSKAEIETRVVDLGLGKFQGVPTQRSLKQVIEAGAARARARQEREN